MSEVVEFRTKVERLQEALIAREHLNVEDLTTHHYADGIYMRELFIPAGHVCVGKIHRMEHLNILLSGMIEVVTEEGSRFMEGPCIVKSPPGVKRAGYAITDTRWLTIHPNPDNEQDLVKLEERYIAPTFDALQADTIPQVGSQ